MAYSKLIVPTAFIYGAEAELAMAQNLALPIAKGFAAFGLAKIIFRDGFEPIFMTVSALLKSDDVEIIQQLKDIQTKRQSICGLDMSKPHVMGILNVTPDSFSDGGRHDDLGKVEAQIDDYIEQGLSIVDIGGESTRPHASYVSCVQEIERIAPLLAMLKAKDICVSVDTRKAKVMDYALSHGADMINDVSALEFRAGEATYGEDSGDSETVVLRSNCSIVLMHSQGTPETMQDDPKYDDILFEIYDYLQQRIECLVAKGVSRARIIIDPGIGFGKSVQHCLVILNNLGLFHSLGVPLLVGASRKSFIGHINAQSDASQRLGGSLAVAQLALGAGVQLHRMHDVKESIQQMNTMSAIY